MVDGIPYSARISSIFPRLILSNDFLKSTRIISGFRSWLLIPSINLLIARMCEIVDIPDMNPFWLGLNRRSIYGENRFNSILFIICAMTAYNAIPLFLYCNPLYQLLLGCKILE